MNPHRGSDFNEFLIEENLMTPTPRTDEEAEYWLDPAMSGEHQIVPADFARQLEREIAVWKHEAKRLDEQLKAMEETAIEWWCEYQDLKAKARQT